MVYICRVIIRYHILVRESTHLYSFSYDIVIQLKSHKNIFRGKNSKFQVHSNQLIAVGGIAQAKHIAFQKYQTFHNICRD